jgi:aminoglycoside phosphotransferase (APT) family kinase protein
MQALWESPFGQLGDVALAEPLGFLSDLNVLVQGPVREEQTLQELIADAVRSGAPDMLDGLHGVLRKSAAGLAALHRSEVRVGAVRTWQDELAEVRSVVDDLAAALPALSDAAEPLLAYLEALAARAAADPVMAAHGTFRPGHVLTFQGEIGFIDFDSFCQAEPSLDLSLFLRRTKDIALGVLGEATDEPIELTRREVLLARAEDICEVFLDEYARHVPVSRRRCALWEALDLFTLVLHSWTKVKPRRLDNAMLALERHLHGLGL